MQVFVDCFFDFVVVAFFILLFLSHSLKSFILMFFLFLPIYRPLQTIRFVPRSCCLLFVAFLLLFCCFSANLSKVFHLSRRAVILYIFQLLLLLLLLCGFIHYNYYYVLYFVVDFRNDLDFRC